MVSKAILRTIPDIDDLIKLTKSIAMLDAILCEEWEYRYYSFNSRWDNGQMMASMRDGAGDHYFIWFGEVGAAIKGFAHESFMSPYRHDGEVLPGVLDGVPSEFHDFLNEPAFSMQDTTFALWRRKRDSSWSTGDVSIPADAGEDPDGSEALLGILDGEPSTYVQFASDYYEVDVDEIDVVYVYEHGELTEELLARFGCERTVEQLAKDVAEIGYLNICS